jgi:hypothetical protein
MEINFIRISPSVIGMMDREPLLQKGCGAGLVEMRNRQSCKIRQLRDALTAAGFVTLDEQANALGVCRSTTWTIVNGNHKGSGLSATTINHILRAPQLPPVVRAQILEYVKEKAAGSYGHSEEKRSLFIARLSAFRSCLDRHWSYRRAA